MTDGEYRARQDELTKALQRLAAASEDRIRGSVEWYTTWREAHPKSPDLTANPKWQELKKPAAERATAESIQDCTEWLDLAITAYQLATDALIAGDSAGADTLTSMGNIAHQQATACIQILL